MLPTSHQQNDTKKRIALIVLLVTIGTLAFAGTTTSITIPSQVSNALPVLTPFESLSYRPLPSEIKQAIVYLAGNKELSDTMIALAMCESSLRPHVFVVDTNGKISYGLFQFQKSSFYRYGSGDWKNPRDQIITTLKVIELGRAKYEWVTCWKKIHKKPALTAGAKD